MNGKKGFTLVELLAVIAILAILVIIALPNVMGMFNEAKESSFKTELKNIYKVAQQQWISDSMFSTGEKEYVRNSTGTCSKELNLNGRKELNYYIKINKSGEVVNFYASDGTYQFVSEDVLNITDIMDVQSVADLKDYEVISINCNGATHPERPHTCVSFAEDSWDDIQYNVSSNYTSCYHVGDTKEVELSGLGTYTLRISNMSNPDICSTSGFSQTACGFVIEFKDLIEKRVFNSTATNRGGWRDSEARAYLNNELLNKFPNDLKKHIKNTFVVSGHESGVSNNYETYDKLYLISTSELWQKVGTNDIGYDSADTLTRQLDYYAQIPVTSTSYSGAVKRLNGSALQWWLRSAHKTSTNYIGNVQSNGKTNAYHGHASLVYGISPAFKIN